MSKRGCTVLRVLAIVLIAGSTCCVAVPAEWGSIKGRIIVENDPPERPMINAIACNVMLPDETLVLGKNNELANAVVYLRVPGGARPVEIHPDYFAALKKPVTLDHKGCRFVPHIVVASKGQTLEMTNSDPFGVNTHIASLGFNLLIPPNKNNKVLTKVSNTSPLPMTMASNIHPWMKGYLLSLDHPYVAITGTNGSFEIKNLPAGEHEFQFWHESGYLKDARMKVGETDKRGRIKLNVQAGETLDLGDVKVRI